MEARYRNRSGGSPAGTAPSSPGARSAPDGPWCCCTGCWAAGACCPSAARLRPSPSHGYRVILPDLRGHGDSARPHDPARYPPDVLADDGLALIDYLGLSGYYLAGYSLGGKIVLRLLARGARPARAVVGGQGLDALDAESGRTDGYRRLLAAVASGAAFAPGSPEAAFADWIAQTGADPRAVEPGPRQLRRDPARSAGRRSRRPSWW